VKAAADLQPTQTQAVVMFCPGKMCADLVAEMRRQGGSGISFYTISSAGDVFGPAADMGATVAVTQVMPYPWVPGAFAIVDKYQKAMLAAGHSEFGYWSLEGYISAAVLTEGLRRMKGSPSPAALTAAMRSIDHLHLSGFELTMNAQHHDGSTFTEITLARSGDAEASFDGYKALFERADFGENRPEDMRQAGFEAARRCDIQRTKHLLSDGWKRAL